MTTPATCCKRSAAKNGDGVTRSALHVANLSTNRATIPSNIRHKYPSGHQHQRVNLALASPYDWSELNAVLVR